MDGRQAALQGRGRAQFLQGHIRLAAQELTEGLAPGGDFAGPESAAMIAWADVAALAPPLQELLDHPQRDSEALGDLLAGALLLLVRSQDSLAQVQGNRSHHPTLPKPASNGYNFI